MSLSKTSLRESWTPALPLLLASDCDLARRALDVIDIGIVVLSPDLTTILLMNGTARSLLGAHLPSETLDAVEDCRLSRSQRTAAPAVRVDLPEGAVYVRAFANAGTPPVEILLVRREVVRDGAAFQSLNRQYGVERREYQVLNGVRLGKTNRQIAIELGIAEATVALKVRQLLRRFDAPNRTALVRIVEDVLGRRV